MVAEAGQKRAATEAAAERERLLRPVQQKLKTAEAAEGYAKEGVRTAAAEKAGASAELKAAKLEHARRLQAELDQAEPALQESVGKGRRLLAESETFKQTVSAAAPSAGGRSSNLLSVPFEVFRPDFITADAIRAYPKLGALARQHFGPTFLSELTESGKKFGTHSMKNRSALLNQWVKENGEKAAREKGAAWAQDLAALMLGDESLSKFIAPGAAKSAEKVAAGVATAKEAREFVNSFQRTIQGHIDSPEVAAARGRFKQADVAAAEATATHKLSAEAAEKAAAQQEKRLAESTLAASTTQAEAAKHRDLLNRLKASKLKGTAEYANTPEYAAAAETAKKAAEATLKAQLAMKGRGAVYGDQPHRTVIRALGESMGNRLVGAQVGGEIGKSIAGSPGKVVGSVLGAAAGSSGRGVSKAMYSVGSALKTIGAAPPGVRGALGVIENLRRTRGDTAAQAALHTLLQKSPALKAWLDAQGKEENAVRK
jgi:outer membrane lipoprotein SlyB